MIGVPEIDRTLTRNCVLKTERVQREERWNDFNAWLDHALLPLPAGDRDSESLARRVRRLTRESPATVGFRGDRRSDRIRPARLCVFYRPVPRVCGRCQASWPAHHRSLQAVQHRVGVDVVPDVADILLGAGSEDEQFQFLARFCYPLR